MQKELLSVFLEKYDDVLERRKIDDEIDFLTGLVKTNQNNQSRQTNQNHSRHDIMTNSFNQSLYEEEQFEMDQLRSVPVRGLYNQKQLTKLQEMVNAQKYLHELVKAGVRHNYY